LVKTGHLHQVCQAVLADKKKQPAELQCSSSHEHLSACNLANDLKKQRISKVKDVGKELKVIWSFCFVL